MKRNLHGMEKTCTKCHETKPLSEFFKDARNTGPKGLGVGANCKSCNKKKKRKWYDDNLTHYKEYNQSYYEANKVRQKIRKYGLKPTEYEHLLSQQNNKCAICGEPPNGKALAIDHDHATGKVRGLLCHSCNNGLGRFKDSIELLHKAASYLGG
jgi:hypothetical protein